MRDRTDLEHLTGELDSARGLTEALRSQAHESSNRLHAIVSLIELGHPERALAFATDELQVSQRLTDSVVGSVDEPALTALLLGKAAQAAERGIDFRIAEDAAWPRDTTPVRDVVTIVGNLIDNAFDAVTPEPGERRVEVSSRVEGEHVVLSVADSGPGLPRTRSTRPSVVGSPPRSRAAPAVAASGWRWWRSRWPGSVGRWRCPVRRAPGSRCGCRWRRGPMPDDATAPTTSGPVRSGEVPRDGTGRTTFRVLVVEDEPVALEAHAAYVERVPGFAVAATAATSHEALRALQSTEVDVVLLDMNLPDRHGLDVIRAMRAGGHRADVIAVTSARDLDVVRAAVSLGVVQYLLKPFVFATLRDRLEAYRAYRAQLGDAQELSTQAEVDQVVAGVRSSSPTALAQGDGRGPARQGHPGAARLRRRACPRASSPRRSGSAA